MKTLEEHNAEVFSRQLQHGQKVGLGIQCPNCEAELYNPEPGITLTSNPPQQYVACSKCDYRGTSFI